MADEYLEEILAEPTARPGDVEMGDGERIMEESTIGIEGELPFAEGDPDEAKTAFVNYLASPIVTLLVGKGETETMVTAHQALLVKSPFFQAACAAFPEDGSVSCGHAGFSSFLEQPLI
jgi:hypothetical protein